MNCCVMVTPARDEEGLLPGLLMSVIAQTVRPARWVIIDDGSSDATAAIAERAAHDEPWIEIRRLPRRGPRVEGGESAVARVLRESGLQSFDYLLRVDADLSFGPRLIQDLLQEFARDPQLGIAGPTLLEPGGQGWCPVLQPAFHIRGAAKMYSRPCLEQIGPLESGLGWDTVDEARAMMLGFHTRSFTYIVARHHRPQGAAGGNWKARAAAGMAAYRAGYAPLFVAARALRQSVLGGGPMGALAFVAGYCDGLRRQVPRAASPELMRFVRGQQLRRLLGMASLWR